jgi:basic membrane protein A
MNPDPSVQMKPGLNAILLATILALMLVVSGCTQRSSTPDPVVYIVYGSEKGDLSYTDAAYRGLAAVQNETPIIIQEFVPRDFETLPDLLNSTKNAERPGLVITVGFQYADFTRKLADAHPDIRFLAIDQAGIGSENLRSYEISSYGDSYLAGVLAASASRTGHAGIIAGMQSDVLDQFLAGYAAGARSVNASIIIDQAYVRQNSTAGFADPVEAGRIAEGMYRNGTDVIFTCAGYSNTGVFVAAANSTGRYVIGTDSDQSPLGPAFVLASAVKRVDRIVYTGVKEHLGGSFTGGNRVVGLADADTAIVYNPRFDSWNATVSAHEDRARDEEAKYLRARAQQAQK